MWKKWSVGSLKRMEGVGEGEETGIEADERSDGVTAIVDDGDTLTNKSWNYILCLDRGISLVSLI